MRRFLLTISLLLIGLVLVGGAAESFVGTSLLPLTQMVGTSPSAAGAVLGLGLMAAAINPPASKGWVRAGILYGFMVVGLEAGGYFLHHDQVHIAPILFGLLCSLLLIALYPQRQAAAPTSTIAASSAVAPPAPPAVDVDAGAATLPEKTP